MSAIEKRLTAAAFDALNTIGELAAKFGGDDGKHAQTVLKAISAIVQSIKDGFERKIDPKEVLAQIEGSLGQLEADIQQNDAAADKALADKFPAETKPPTLGEMMQAAELQRDMADEPDDKPDLDDIDR